MEELIIALVVLLITYPIIRIGLFMRNYIEISIGDQKVSAKAIEWADKLRLNPYGFLVTCPHCHKEQWFQKSTLYIAHDNTKNNLRCKFCRKGKQPKRMWGDPTYSSHPNFRPKNPGWRSLDTPPE